MKELICQLLIPNVLLIEKSTIDIIQCFGRGSRLYDGKQMTKILVPYKCNTDTIDDATVFGILINIVKSLYDQDSAIVDYFNKKTTGGVVNKQIIKQANYTGNVAVFTDVKIQEWCGKLELYVHKRVNNFDFMYEKLKVFVETNKKLPSKDSKQQEEKQLGSWCSGKRKYKKREY